MLKKSVTISVVVVLFILSCGGSINPLTWKSQVERRISPQIMIQPEEVAEFSQEIGSGIHDLSHIGEFIEAEISYANDLVAHASIDHLPTAEEVLLSRKDDCDGHAVLLCSVLRYAGYDAYAVVGPSHAWVEVHTDTVLSVNNQGKDWYVKFNESTVEWNFGPLCVLIVEEFTLLTIFFLAMIYAYEMGVFTYVQEFLGYFKYILLFFIGYILIGVLILVTRSTVWIIGLILVLTTVLSFMKLISKLH